jgi:hypothetical protein
VKGSVTANVRVLGVAYEVNKEEATIISLNIIFVIQTTCVFCEEGNKCLNIIWINLGFKFARSSIICVRLYALCFYFELVFVSRLYVNQIYQN